MAEDLIARLRAPCGESLTLLVAEGGQEKFDPLRLAAAREIERLRAALEQIAKPSVRGLVRSTNDLEHIAREALRATPETSTPP